jgi:lysozyme family protein
MRIKCFVDSLRRETIIELFLWNISNATFRLGIKKGFGAGTTIGLPERFSFYTALFWTN